MYDRVIQVKNARGETSTMHEIFKVILGLDFIMITCNVYVHVDHIKVNQKIIIIIIMISQT